MTSRRVASTVGRSPVQKCLQGKCNHQVYGDSLFTDEEIQVLELGEKIIKFVQESDNFFKILGRGYSGMFI